MLFLKKRPALPKKPDLSKEGDFSLFVSKDAGNTTEVLIPAETITAPQGGRGVYSKPVVDVVDETMPPCTPLLKIEKNTQRERASEVAFVERPVVREQSKESAQASLGSSKLRINKKVGVNSVAERLPTKKTMLPAVLQKMKDWKLSLVKSTLLPNATSAAPLSPRNFPSEGGDGMTPNVANKEPSHAKHLPPKTIDIAIDQPQGSLSFWRVGENTLKLVTKEDVAAALHFRTSDKHFTTKGTVSNVRARTQAENDSGGPRSVINMSQTSRTVHTMSYPEIQEAGHKIGPGLLLLNRLLAANVKRGQAVIAGLLLSDEKAGSASLAIFYYLSEEGISSAPHIYNSPADLTILLSQFATSMQVDVARTEVVLFRNKDLMAASKNAIYFPAKAPVTYLSQTSVTAVGAGLCGLFAIVTGLSAAGSYAQVQTLNAKNEQVTSVLAAKKTAIQLKIIGSISTFAHAQSLDTDSITERAGNLWVPSSVVSVHADLARQVYDVSYMTPEQDPTQIALSGAPALAKPKSEPTSLFVLPSGCKKEVRPNIRETHATKATVVCETSNPTFSKYRLD
ncbi:MAG: hypothetical protein Q7S87_08745 [Agitococcus sp.]|nr:hypothetical protein [Agitococcus sp.]MDO9176985.1 hypothetical protein [Agitococcus sp.]